MTQPKTTAEFMALPVRQPVNYTETRVGNVTTRVPVAVVGYAVYYEPDTIVMCAAYRLARDEDVYCRIPEPGHE